MHFDCADEAEEPAVRPGPAQQRGAGAVGNEGYRGAGVRYEIAQTHLPVRGVGAYYPRLEEARRREATGARAAAAEGQAVGRFGVKQ